MQRVEVSTHLSPQLLYVLQILLDVDATLIQAAWRDCSRVGRGYFVSQIVQANGKSRKIHHPTQYMKTLQRRILSQVLYKLPISQFAFGGVPSRSYIDAARIHLKQDGHVVQLDIKDAFPSTSYAQISKYLRHALKHQLWTLGLKSEQRKVLIGFLTHMMVVNPQGGRFPSLPLGTPTSVALFNVMWAPIDADIKALLIQLMPQQQIRYTRYVDDITISSHETLHPDMIARISYIIQNYGYQLNMNKIKSAQRDQACIHGLCWKNNSLSLPDKQIITLAKRIHQLQALQLKHPTPQEWSDAHQLLQEVQYILVQVYGNGPYPQGLQIDPNLVEHIKSHTTHTQARWAEELWG